MGKRSFTGTGVLGELRHCWEGHHDLRTVLGWASSGAALPLKRKLQALDLKTGPLRLRFGKRTLWGETRVMRQYHLWGKCLKRCDTEMVLERILLRCSRVMAETDQAMSCNNWSISAPL